MKKRRKLVLFALAACIFSVALAVLFAPTRWYVFVSHKAEPLYLKYFVNIPRGDDMHRFYVNHGYTSPNAYIAHGGGIKQYVYNNSLEAALNSIANGFRFIEFDLLVTSDGHLVGGHSWREIRQMAHLPAGDEPLPLAAVMEKSRPGEFSPVTAKDICRLLEENPGLMVVTDIIGDYELLLREIPYSDRLIVEVFGGAYGYQRAIEAGVRYPSLSVHGVAQMKLARDCGIPIVSMCDEHFFLSPEGVKLVKEMHDMGITILLFNSHGDAYWDTEEFIREHLGRSFSMIYTDSWSPTHLPHSVSSSAPSPNPPTG